ncbi:MAG: M28 family peptidase [Bryobacteraceae bacterium]
MLRSLVLLLAAAIALPAADYKLDLTPELRQLLDRISADSLKGNLSFLSSDLLEGRATPSRGLDIAAEFIASQFRRAGLEPGGNDGYFQVAQYRHTSIVNTGIDVKLTIGDKTFQASEASALAPQSMNASGLTVVKAEADLSKMKPEDVAGTALVVSGGPRGMLQALGQIGRLKPAVVVIADASAARFLSRLQLQEANTPGGPPIVVVQNTYLNTAMRDLAAGSAAKLDVAVGASMVTPTPLRNVVAILRGSDPVLRETALVVSAHYDHIGMLPPGDGDRINNGANDDGSGVVSVIEVASTLAKLPTRPRRSIVFVTFFGEELGGYGSRWFGGHPPFPAAKIAGHINLEQLGRTDGSDGPHVNDASITGFDYSDLTSAFVNAGALTGIKVYKDPVNSDAYFSRSDNQSLANIGVPAHTMGVTFAFPDYHRPGDHWEKIDYDNLARIDRMVALGVLALAQSADAPKWNADNPKTKNYVDAAKKLAEQKPDPK